MSKIISKESIMRLLRDVKQIMQNPLIDNGIYYVHDDTEMLQGYAMIVGPKDTPYFGGFYFFEMSYPVDYPHSPPKVKYWTNGSDVRFNPNLYKCGKVCISLLNTWSGEQWTSCQTISTILLTLCTLLCENPLLNEPGVKKDNPDINSYNEIIIYSNLNVAICDIIQKTKGVYQSFFSSFEPFINELFLKNYDALIEISNVKNSQLQGSAKNFKTQFYSMSINVDYNKLIKKLEETKLLLT
jgi:ubiquitin-conjugating enzyme E2 Z